MILTRYVHAITNKEKVQPFFFDNAPIGFYGRDRNVLLLRQSIFTIFPK